MSNVARIPMSMKVGEWLRSDFFSVGVSQTIAALGQIIGVRLLTEALSPAVFGEVILIVGLSTLATSVLVNPTMQALLRYYPEGAQSGNEAPVERAALQRIIRNSAIALPLSIPLGIFSVVAGWLSLTVLILLPILVAVDGMRMLRTTIMNASRQHHRYGVWQIGEAWGRPVLAYGAIVWWGIQTEIVLGAYIVTSLVLYGCMRYSIDAPSTAIPSREFNEEDLLQKFKDYGRPLIPLGLLGWISGMADRYMIGSMLSAQNVGMYAAAYGLASRPLLMLSTIAETAIRPVYYSAIARKDWPASRLYLTRWFAVVFAGGITTCLLFALFHQQLVYLLLGPGFREASYLMPWIAAGYGILALYHISVRVCLAHDAPQAVTLTETAGAILAVAIGFILIRDYGLLGAAMAVPIYCGIQLVASVGFAIRSVRPNGH
jgi:O-antigen/teichoic acid export membrane protein